ncbi:hypothetical protein COY87_00610 [Candidatus Roizmanbacteria bacterium CG_4_10_14_0_8_um_filter_33_9]|uniref:Hexokinase C-terminal domain-containing protein n=1 Tax=Candidatus Roizmanbacteria bacterium CG_4_10_14_0_8_um_filter_33_9 TaxID=1974826 RepID=A0A2M7QJL4_9BACT|nr:MAG: hypothetical protein COY87_00610 [Candidatus Roizmanbacteria bacterium CG_4_10_14_0_8_um_filter_33_9]
MNNYILPYTLAQLQRITHLFQKEIILSKQNKKTSLSYFSYPLPHTHTCSEPFQSMIVGGSVFEKAIIKKTGKQITILNLTKSHVPLFTNKEVFLRFIHSHIELSVLYIAINFTYPSQPVIINNIIDGRLSSGTKGHAFIGLIGKNVGEELSDYVRKKSGKHILFTLANDTICLLLAGMKNISTIIAGGVVGTGMNFGFFDGKHLINLESGNFSAFPQTETGKQVDKQSNNPGLQLFEKEVSGKYLFKHFNLISKQKNIPLSLSSTSNLHDLALDNNDLPSHIAQSLFERSASLAACQIAGIYHFLNQKQLEFIMEGTVFWTGWNFKSMVEKYLILLGIPQEAVQFTKIEHSNILGAAKLVTGI